MTQAVSGSTTPFLSGIFEPKDLVGRFAIRVKPAKSYTVVQEKVFAEGKTIMRKGDILIHQILSSDSYMDKPVLIACSKSTGKISVITVLSAGSTEEQLDDIFLDKAWRAVPPDYRPTASHVII